MEWSFWTLAAVVVYVYVGYPALVRLMARLRPRRVRKRDIGLPVTAIVTAFNEQASIARKLESLVAQDYGAGLLEIVVASDGSTDATDEIVRSFADRGVRLLRVEGRQGKTAAQNAAAREARGDVLVFTDATSPLEPHAIRTLVRSFADPDVGVVGAPVDYVAAARTGVGSGCVSYGAYERALQRDEALVNSLVGVRGSLYAVRRTAYREIPPDLISDFVVALNAYEDGFRAAFEEDISSLETALDSPSQEFAMRVRVALRSYAALWAKRRMLNPFRFGFFAIQLISHKVLRYLVPLFLAGLLATNAVLAHSPGYAGILGAQLLFYGAALAGHLLQRRRAASGPWSKPYYFTLANLAALVALAGFLRGRRIVTWTPIR